MLSNTHFILVGKNPVPVDDMLSWARWFEWNSTHGTRHVAHTHIKPRKPLGKKGRMKAKLDYYRKQPVTLSTVFLGLNHNWTGGRPLVFETLVFGGRYDGLMYRYASFDEALQGHNSILKVLGVI